MRLFAFLLASSLLTASAWAAPAGKTVDTAPVARISSGTAPGNLAVGNPVYMGDVIETGGGGNAQILFNDNTKLVVGPSSRLKITKYVASGSSASSFSVNALTGAFRFITGVSAKPAYQITTPTASIAVRGTEFDFGVRGGAGRTYVLLYRGGVRLCGSAGSCRDLRDRCQLAGTSSDGNARLARESDFLPRRFDLSQSFPYVRSQNALNSEFQIADARACRSAVGQSRGRINGGGDGEPSGRSGGGGGQSPGGDVGSDGQ